MTLSNFLLSYMILVMIASLGISGWYSITRGRWEVDIDGKLVVKGMLLKYWSIFWNQETGSNKKFYSGDKFFDLYTEVIRPTYRQYITGERIQDKECCLVYTTEGVLMKHPERELILSEICRKAKVEYMLSSYLGDPTKDLCIFYKVIPTYLFPEWIRKPIANCLLCHSSVYGLLVYTFVYQIAGKELFQWCNDDMMVVLPAGFWFCFCIAAVNNLFTPKKS